MARNTFEAPALNVLCDVCGAWHGATFSYEVSGKRVCIKCARYKHVVHAFRYVEYMAAKDCRDECVVVQEENDYVEFATWSPTKACRLDCPCETCAARKVLKFIQKMTS